ncbi:hypothetical protein Vretifemale_18531, partial [Volvox reticuliferus]
MPPPQRQHQPWLDLFQKRRQRHQPSQVKMLPYAQVVAEVIRPRPFDARFHYADEAAPGQARLPTRSCPIAPSPPVAAPHVLCSSSPYLPPTTAAPADNALVLPGAVASEPHLSALPPEKPQPLGQPPPELPWAEAVGPLTFLTLELAHASLAIPPPADYRLSPSLLLLLVPLP